jgi:heme o synthase
MRKVLHQYYVLTKPGIIRGNLIHTLAGALLAATWIPDWQLIVGVLIGTSLVIASACVVNNYLDRKIDAKMKRTKERASVTGDIPVVHGLLFSVELLMAGFAVLVVLTNWIVVVIGIIAYLMYVLAYTLSKPRSVHSTLIGAIPGALPAMAGYVAVTGELTVSAWLIFLLVAVWQLPHFYAISVFRKQEYKAAGVPVLGVVKPFRVVKIYVLSYQMLYACVVTALIYTETVAPLAGFILLIGAAYWLYVYAFTKGSEVKWAKSIFGSSLVLTLLLLMAAVVNMFLHTPS